MGQGYKWWTWAATAVLFAGVVILSVMGQPKDVEEEVASLSPATARFMADPAFEDVYWTVQGHCSMCHAEEPLWPGLHWAPKAVVLETEAQVARAAQAIYLQSGVSHAMPPGSTVLMDDYAREDIRNWFERAAGS